ncbi:MAG: ATP-binding protein [Steroidobacteraceae bacterium]
MLFEVADTGIGIAPENHRRSFDEFSQVENPLQTSVKGTGLGLPLSQRLAGLLGGSIEIRSQPDVIVLDLMMPDIHAFEVLKMLKAIEDTRRIPVVLFTSQCPEHDDDRELSAAADALLLKSELSRDTVTSTMQRIRGQTETDHARNA